jgi:hypothetical protein
MFARSGIIGMALAAASLGAFASPPEPGQYDGPRKRGYDRGPDPEEYRASSRPGKARSKPYRGTGKREAAMRGRKANRLRQDLEQARR